MSTESFPISSPELVVAHTTPTKSQRRRSNATASETRHVLKSSPGKATTVRLPSPSAVKVSITSPRPEGNDSDDNTQDVADDIQVTVSDIEPAKDFASPSAKITITVLKGDDIDANCARLTYLCPISEDEVTVPVEEKEPLPLDQPVFIRPSRVPERSVLSLPALCDGPPTPLEPLFKRASPPPLQFYRREPEEVDVSIRRDSLDSEISSTGYERTRRTTTTWSVHPTPSPTRTAAMRMTTRIISCRFPTSLAKSPRPLSRTTKTSPFQRTRVACLCPVAQLRRRVYPALFCGWLKVEWRRLCSGCVGRRDGAQSRLLLSAMRMWMSPSMSRRNPSSWLSTRI
ncbi:hypothetical protein CPB85DRAFT_1338425, partial [Mucidula mucida]